MLKGLLTLSIFISTNIFAQAIVPCVTRTGKIDLSCGCAKKKTCMQAMDNREKKAVKSLNAKIGHDNFVMKNIKTSMPALKQMKKVFNGQVDVHNFPHEKINKISAKLDKINKKLIKAVEKRYKEKGIKTYKIKDRVKKLNGRIEKILGDQAVTALKNNQVQVTPENIFQGSKPKVLASSSGGTRPGDQGDTATSISDTSKLEKNKKQVAQNKVSNEFSLRASQEEVNRMKNKKFAIDTVIKDSSKDIFMIISKRYKASINTRITAIDPEKDREDRLYNLFLQNYAKGN